MKNPNGFIERQAKSGTPYVTLGFFTFFFLLAIGFWGHMVTQNEMRQLLESQLLTTLHSSQESIRLWCENQKRFARSWAEQYQVRKNILSLIASAKDMRYQKEALLKAEELTFLRKILKPVVNEFDMVGFVIFDKEGMQVGALLNDPIGQKDLITRSDFVQRSLNGETVVSVPFKGEIPLPDKNEVLRTNWPTMFVSTPLLNDSGKVAGVLAFRLRPEQSFTRVLEISRLGSTGETFTFNSRGYLLSAPRYLDQIRKLGLASTSSESTPILNVQLLEPAKAANSVDNQKEEGKPPGFTEMAANALQKGAGVNTKGYLNYVGISVIGAWVWLEDLNMGLAVEQEVEEAFAPLIALRSVLFKVFLLLGLMSCIAFMLRISQSRTEEKERSTLKALKEREEEYRAIVNNAVEAIITFNPEGEIQTVNPAAEAMFGFDPGRLVRMNILNIIPQNNLEDPVFNLKDIIQTQQEETFIRARELVAVKKNGVSFPVELTLSTMHMNDESQYIGLIRDITERKRALEQLEQLNSKNQLILNAAGEGIFGVDIEGLITFINPAGAKILGFRPEEMIGKPQHLIMQPVHDDGVPCTLEDNPIYQVYREGIVRQVSQKFFRRRDGNTFPVEYIGKPIWEDKKIVGAVVTFRNISDYLQSEQDLRQYAQDLEKINTELRNFTGVATHDLQEPLRKVVTLADRLTMTNASRMDEKGRDYLDRIVTSIGRMQQLIVDLLEYSKTTSTRQDFRKVKIDEEIHDVLSTLDIQIEKTRAQVNVADLPEIEASPFQIRQLFQNLIGNALKFHKPGIPPQVQIRAEKRIDGSWAIVVEDEGIGFDEKYLDRIFQPFRRLHRQEEYEGSGMGLAVCEKIVTLHRGMITAESKKNLGSRFIIVLPEKQINGH
ncbi:MAG: PAS domain S-box protein [Candidatus Nitronauta litoralis]|uniref:histidine kinase n=1 Tax=Candidatus Nitronauta litoralis TaxID=2705533 RepID=A0A7T0BUR3_9BACT|nr:MAG: PAS domain S-box protein [Candidatus Nitronauta litoralis]